MLIHVSFEIFRIELNKLPDHFNLTRLPVINLSSTSVFRPFLALISVVTRSPRPHNCSPDNWIPRLGLFIALPCHTYILITFREGVKRLNDLFFGMNLAYQKNKFKWLTPSKSCLYYMRGRKFPTFRVPRLPLGIWGRIDQSKRGLIYALFVLSSIQLRQSS